MLTTRKSVVLLLSCCTALAIFAAGCGQKAKEEPAGKPELLNAVSADIQTLYKSKCMSCHGDGLQGRIGPSTNLTQVGARLTAEQIETQIRKGGNGMPGFQDNLKPEQISSLRDWLSGLK